MGQVLAEAHPEVQYGWTPLPRSPAHLPDLGAEAGVPLEVMMAQLGHMDRETSLEYVHIQQQALERAKQLIDQSRPQYLLQRRDHLAQPMEVRLRRYSSLDLKPGLSFR